MLVAASQRLVSQKEISHSFALLDCLAGQTKVITMTSP